MIYLISACLAGQAVRYDGKAYQHDRIQRLIQQKQVILACPEMLGGLTIPRQPAEIVGGTGSDVLARKAQVIDIDGNDVTQAFISGAEKTLAFAQQHQVDIIVLKENSPSCGRHLIYNGKFSGQKVQGMGVTATLLTQQGFQVVSEHDFLNSL